MRRTTVDVDLGGASGAPAAGPTASRAPGAPAAGPPSAARPGELSGRLAGLSLPRQVFVLATWPLLEQLMNFLVGTVDLMLAARLEPEPVALAGTDALGVAGYIGWLLGMLHMAVGVGASALVARAVGGRHRRLANAALGQGVLLALCTGTVIGAIIFAGARAIGATAKLSEAALAMCVTYLWIIASVAPLSAVLFVGNACLRGAGDTLTPFWVMVVVNVVNIVASVLLVFGPEPIGGHGVAGIAVGTALAWTVGAVMVVVVLARGRDELRLRLLRLRPHWHTARRIVRVGVPNLVESAGIWLGNFAVLMIIGTLALEGVIGAHMIAIRIESVSFLLGMALGVAAATLAGQYLGAGNPQRARQAVGLCWAIAVALMCSLGVLFIAIPELLVRIISDTSLHLELVPPVVRLAGWIQIFFATYIVLSNALRGAGDTTTAMMMTYASTFLVRLPAAWVMAVPLDMGFFGVWIALCAELGVRGALFAGRYLLGGWTRVQV